MAFESPSDVTEANRLAWEEDRYDAWVAAFGGIEAAAQQIVSDPAHPLRRILPYVGPVDGQRVCSVQGSHGRIAVALAILGAKVQVIDFSEENQRFAEDLAAAAGVSIDYAVTDVLQAGALGLEGAFDLLVLELGILHYHIDLERFFAVMRELAKAGGTLFLNEFHPVQRKLFWESGPGDYFASDMVTAPVPMPDGVALGGGECRYRFWTMGEVVNAAIKSGFEISRLDEHPDWEASSVPGTFTLLARAR